MTYNFNATYATGPTAITPGSKDVQTKAIKLTFADFTTGGANALKAVLPADASIISMRYWKKTQFSGGSVSAATLSIGIPGTNTFFVSAFDVFTPAAGTFGILTPITNIFQDYQIPWGADIQINTTGTATTGNPTAGEMYIVIEYIR